MSEVAEMSARPVIKRWADVEESKMGRAKGTTVRVVLGTKERVPNFIMRVFTIEPGGYIPAHVHGKMEHEQLVLEGEMELGLDEEKVTVKAGEAVFIPAGVVHWYRNRGSVPVRFLCVIPKLEDPQTKWLEQMAEPGEK